MKIISLAAGAGGMYCGSCLRDNRLAATLLRAGRDVTLMPLYTPLRTDEASVSSRNVFFGGINVFLQHSTALFRQTPRIVDSILDSNFLLRGVGRFAPATRPETLGSLTVSVLEGDNGRQRKELRRLIAALASTKPDLINVPNLMFAGVARAIKTELGLPVVCTLSGEDMFLDQLVEPHRSQAFALIEKHCAHIDAFVAVTKYFAARAVKHFSLPAERVHYVPMGVRVNDFSPATETPVGPFTIGHLARICNEKGLMKLAEAFVALRSKGRDCKLAIAGYLSPADRPYWDEVSAYLHSHGQDDHVTMHGEVSLDQKVRFLQSLHVLSVPAVYPEAKGFYVLEAAACGVPVVQPTAGSFPELIEQTGGGVLFDSDTPGKLADAIASLMDDESRRQSLAMSARRTVAERFSDDVMAEATWKLYEQVVAT